MQTKKQPVAITADNITNPHTIASFAAYIGVSYNTAWGLVHSGRVKAVRVGEQWRVNVPESLAMLGY